MDSPERQSHESKTSIIKRGHRKTFSCVDKHVKKSTMTESNKGVSFRNKK